MTRPKFKVGDRVRRPSDIHKGGSPWLRGTVVGVRKWKNGFLYDVQWESKGGEPIVPDRYEYGFLDRGLQPDEVQTSQPSTPKRKDI
jgi:hypothetical protein